jgi:ribonuclease III
VADRVAGKADGTKTPVRSAAPKPVAELNAPALNASLLNAKGELIAACRTQGLPDPSFESTSGGPGHAPVFRCTVTVGERELGGGEGRSKRDAERAASLEALSVLLTAQTPSSTTEPFSTAPTSPNGSQIRWPIYADVLSQALLVAHERSEDSQLAEVALTQIATDAAALYRRLLTELGHTPEQA